MCAVFGCNPAVVDGLRAVVRSPSTPRGGQGALVGGILTLAGRAIPCGSIQIAGRVVTGFGLSITQPSCDVTVLGRQPGFAPAHTSQFVGPGIFAVPGRLHPIFGCDLSVVDGLGAVVRSLSVPRRTLCTFACRMLTLARCAIPRRSVEITRRIVTRLSLSVALLGLSVAYVRSQIAVSPLDIALARRCGGVFV